MKLVHRENKAVKKTNKKYFLNPCVVHMCSPKYPYDFLLAGLKSRIFHKMGKILQISFSWSDSSFTVNFQIMKQDVT